MLKRLITAIRAFFTDPRDLRCRLGFHHWVDSGERGAKTIIYVCDRHDCMAASRLLASGRRVTWKREEVTYEQVSKLNRHERRRLGAMARRGAFGKIEG